MESTKTAELMSLNLKGVYQGSAGQAGAQTPRITKLQTERFKKDKFNGTGILIPNKSIRAHKELTSDRLGLHHLSSLVSASRTPARQTRLQAEHKNAYSVGLKGYTGFDSQQDYTENWQTLENASSLRRDSIETNKFYARGKVSDSLVPIYVTQAEPKEGSTVQEEDALGSKENQLEFKGKYHKRKTFGKLSQNQELNDWKKQKCAGGPAGKMLLKTKEEKVTKKIQGAAKTGAGYANELLQKAHNAPSATRNADSAPSPSHLDHHLSRRSAQAAEMPNMMNMSKGPRNSESQKTPLMLKSTRGLSQPRFLPKTGRLGKSTLPLSHKNADDVLDQKAATSPMVTNPPSSIQDNATPSNPGHISTKTVQGLREDIQGPSANRMPVIDSKQNILQNFEKIKFQNVYLREKNIKNELSEHTRQGTAAQKISVLQNRANKQLQPNSMKREPPAEGKIGEASGSVDDGRASSQSKQEPERQRNLQKRTGEIEDGHKNIINTHYSNSVTTAKLVQVGLDQVRLGPPRSPARGMAGNSKDAEQKGSFGIGSEAARRGKQQSSQNAAHSARVFIFNKDGVQQAREMPDAGLHNTHDIGVGIGTFVSNIQTSTTSGGLQVVPYPQSPTLNTAKMAEEKGSAETITHQYTVKRSLRNTLNVASFGETLGPQNSGEGNINTALVHSGRNSKVKVVQGGSVMPGPGEREEREGQQTLMTDKSPSVAKHMKEAATVDAEPVKLSNEKKMINLASLSQDIAEELADYGNEADDQADKSEATNVSQQHHQIQKPIMINEDSVTDVCQGTQSPAFNKQPLIVEHRAQALNTMRNSRNTVDDMDNGNIAHAEAITPQTTVNVRGYKTPAGNSRMATSPDRSASIMNPTMGLNLFDKQLTNNLNENSQCQFEIPDNIKELQSAGDSAGGIAKKKTQIRRSQDNKEARTTRGNHSNRREDSAEKSLDSARNSASKYSKFTGISMQHGKQTKAQVLFPNMKPKQEIQYDSKYINTLKPLKPQKQQSTQIMELSGRPGERPSLEKLEEQSGELHVKSGEFPFQSDKSFHKKLAGNFTTQVESHYQIDNLQKSKAELEASGAIYEEKEVSDRTTPGGLNGAKTQEEYANIIILKKESAESTGSKQQQRLYKISRPQSKCLLLETENGEIPAESTAGARRINCHNLSNESGTLELLNGGFAHGQVPLSSQTLRVNEQELSPYPNLNYQFQLQQQQSIQLVDLGQLLDESSRMQHFHEANQLGAPSQAYHHEKGATKSSSPFQSPRRPPFQHEQDLELHFMTIQPSKQSENQQINPEIEQQQQKLLQMQQNLQVFQQIDFQKQFENLKRQYENFYWQEMQKVKQQHDEGVAPSEEGATSQSDKVDLAAQFTPHLPKPNMQNQAAGQTPSPRAPAEMPVLPGSPRLAAGGPPEAASARQMPSPRSRDPGSPTRRAPNQMAQTQYLRQFQKDQRAGESPKSTALERHLKFTNKVVKNLTTHLQELSEEAKPKDRSQSRSPPRVIPAGNNKGKARAVATMATGIFIEAIDQSEYKNRFVSQAYAPKPRSMDEQPQQIYNQLMTYMEANAETNFNKNAPALIFNSSLATEQDQTAAKKAFFSAQPQPSDTHVGGATHTDQIASSLHERHASPINDETVLANYLMQKEKRQSKEISKQSSFGLGLHAFDKGEATSSFNNIINEHLLKSDASRHLRGSKGLHPARGTMLATTSNQRLAGSPGIGSQPDSQNTSPKHDRSPPGVGSYHQPLDTSTKSLKRFNEDLIESGNLVMNVRPEHTEASNQPAQLPHVETFDPSDQQNGQIMIKDTN